MAVYVLRARQVSRSKGARVIRAAACRAGCRILDTRTSEVYDYTHRTDVACKEILLPADLAADPDMAWALDRPAYPVAQPDRDHHLDLGLGP